jgi:hypothetical protein
VGKLDTLLNIGILGVQISQQAQLEQMNRQQLQTTVARQLLQALREEIFKFKQAADDILAMVPHAPKTAAAAMGILHEQLQAFGISSDLFPELGDKEYAAATIRTIQVESGRLHEQLPPGEQAEVSGVVAAAVELPRYDYYLAHYQAVQDYRAAKPVYETLKGKNNSLLQILFIGGALMVVPILFIAMCGLMGSMVVEGGISALSCIGGWVGVAVVIGAYLWFRRTVAQGDRFQDAQRRVKAFEKGEVDLQLYEQLERRYGADDAVVSAKRDAAERLVSGFFQESELPYSI